MRAHWWTGVLTAGALATMAVVGGAQSMPRLPDPLPLAMSPASPGQVTFNHVTHVDPARPACLTCHPKDHGILGSRGGRKVPILHAHFDEGRQCGRCHDGTKAFAVTDDCTNCHVVP